MQKERKFLAVFAISVIAMLIAPVISSAMDSNVLQLKISGTEETKTSTIIEKVTENTIESDPGSIVHTNILCTIRISHGEGFIIPPNPSGRETLLQWQFESGHINIKGLLGNTDGEGSSFGYAIFFIGQATDDPTVEINGFALIASYTIS